MALKAYEDACMRAELFGQPKPDRDEFLSKHKHLDVSEFEEVDINSTEVIFILFAKKKVYSHAPKYSYHY